MEVMKLTTPLLKPQLKENEMNLNFLEALGDLSKVIDLYPEVVDLISSKLEKAFDSYASSLENNKGVTPGPSVINLLPNKAPDISERIFNNFPIEQPPVFGLYPPAPLFHPNQDPTFPFFYNPVQDSYVGFRWDYADQGEMCPALTIPELSERNCLCLSPHPYHYHSPWVKTKSRLSEVYFRLPRVLTTPSESQFRSWVHFEDPGVSTKAGKLVLHSSLQWHIEKGYNALMCTENKQFPPELILINPISLVVGVTWREMEIGKDPFEIVKNKPNQLTHETLVFNTGAISPSAPRPTVLQNPLQPTQQSDDLRTLGELRGSPGWNT